MTRNDAQVLEALKDSINVRIGFYKNEYENADAGSIKKRVIEEAATSFLEGIELAVLYGFGQKAFDEIVELIEDLEEENDFIKLHTITGVTLS